MFFVQNLEFRTHDISAAKGIGWLVIRSVEIEHRWGTVGSLTVIVARKIGSSRAQPNRPQSAAESLDMESAHQRGKFEHGLFEFTEGLACLWAELPPRHRAGSLVQRRPDHPSRHCRCR